MMLQWDDKVLALLVYHLVCVYVGGGGGILQASSAASSHMPDASEMEQELFYLSSVSHCKLFLLYNLGHFLFSPADVGIRMLPDRTAMLMSEQGHMT